MKQKGRLAILDQQSPSKGVLAGTVGGVAGVFAMTALQLLVDHLRGAPARAVRELSQRGGRPTLRWHLPQKDATVRAAEQFPIFSGEKRSSPGIDISQACRCIMPLAHRQGNRRLAGRMNFGPNWTLVVNWGFSKWLKRLSQIGCGGWI